MERAAALVARLQASFGLGEGTGKAEDGTPLKYVIYARKSTDTAEKQERSVTDQISECKRLAERAGLRVVEVIHEEKSAMVSDKREKFRAMMDGIKAGIYDGILAWAPDRLARNMKEGGEVIDLLDHGDIKDLRFANNFIFNNDASGNAANGVGKRKFRN